MNANYPFRCDVTQEEILRSRASVTPLKERLIAALEQAGPDAMLVVWISDLHVQAWRDYGETNLGSFGSCLDSSAGLRLALEEIAALDPMPDLLIMGGDLSNNVFRDDEYLSEYSELKSILNQHLPPDLPTLPLLGNHDHGAKDLSPALYQSYADWRRRDWPDFVEPNDFYYSENRSGWRFIALDTRAGKLGPPLSMRQREWLKIQLHDGQTPTIILQHRPFVTCGNWVDDHRFKDDEVFELITQSRAVKAVLSGHTHKAAGWKIGEQAHLILPAVAYPIKDRAGWACLVLSRDRLSQVLIKDMAVQLRFPELAESSGVRTLEMAEYSDSEF